MVVGGHGGGGFLVLILTSSKWVHQCRMCGCCRCIRLWFGFAHFRIALGEFQANGLGHVGIEANSLLQYAQCFKVRWGNNG